MEAISWDVCNSEHLVCSDKVSFLFHRNTHAHSLQFMMEENLGFEEPQPDVPVPFLPLPADFNPASFQDWNLLVQTIESWLVSVIPINSQQWTWGCKTFWLAFVATHPSFPGGRWPMWNSNILKRRGLLQWT